ncbi:hypothetical protein LINPERPRIM_LOCUS40427 [Linum perenne]
MMTTTGSKAHRSLKTWPQISSSICLRQTKTWI